MDQPLIMSSEIEKKVNLKLLVDTKAQKVLFAEAKKDFVDFLISILNLPMGAIVGIGNEQDMAGCLGDLSKSIQALDDDYLQPDMFRGTVTESIAIGGNPVKVSHVLLLTDAPPSQKKLYGCGYGGYSSCRTYVSDSESASCPQCGRNMTSALTYVAPKVLTETTSSSTTGVAGKGYVKGLIIYMVMDNLEVTPMSTISCITLLNKFNVKDVTSLEERVVQVGLREWLAILKSSFEKRDVLTTVFLGVKEQKNLSS